MDEQAEPNLFTPTAIPLTILGLLAMAGVALLWHWAIALLIAIGWAGLAALKVEILHDEEEQGPYDGRPHGMIDTGGGLLFMLGYWAGCIIIGGIVAFGIGYGIYEVGLEFFRWMDAP